ncbi:amidohydrolase family protein [Bordetella bronchiseptica E014]|nr:amidohydrolase family protein [Bordetella bronchiseptica 345]KDC22658.1 amidohydrolase family protein [Bordetella bronchiseptica E014]KDC94612.1 amidohydrolase family protein [Bordetella bronchiseptica MBORD675]KDD15961.1 amidohydrolase family protein [Bordetella bronchiseptica MBORD707]KDD99714.1 amidohydrolase family protein [Bordetella bronchiseptica SBL-F6116]
MRCRPPLPEFREYFDIPRISWHGARTGAKQVSRAFVEGSMDLFFEEMDQAGIEIAVVQGRNSPAVFMGKQFNAAFIPNERLAQIQDQYAGRFVCFAGIDVSNTAHNAVEETVRSIKSLGLKGIFIEPGRQIQSTPDDERIFPVYEKCIELDIPVNLMSGPYAGADIGVSDPLYVDRLCTRYPELKIILGHGGYPYVQQILGVAFKHTNLFVSPDMYVFAPGGQAYIDAANGALRDQMVYGSAYPLRPVTQTVSDTLGLGLSADSERAYLELNARKLLNI